MIYLKILLSAIVLLQLIGLRKQHFQFKKIRMTQEELADALEKVAAQIKKGIDEVVAAVNQQGNTTPRVDAALTALQGFGQQLDDLNADA